MMKFFVCVAVAFMMAGCTMRPPSASAFMAAYQSRSDSSGTVFGGSFAGYAAFSPKSGETAEDSVRLSSWDEVVGHEWKIDENINVYHFIDHFEIGCGLEIMNPYITMGFASDHFGLMGWADWGLFGLFADAPEAFRGGVSLMEQISPTPRMHIGLIQFASRTRAYYWAGDDEFREPYLYSFIEYGGGAYLMYEIKSRLRASFEFRYSYDVTYKSHRLAFNLALLMGVK